MFHTLSKLFLGCFFVVMSGTMWSQVIWTDPVFPTENAAVTVYFDATKGSGGLAGCNCDVYVHTGLITSESSSDSDWKYVMTEWGVANPDWKMTPVAGQPDIYSFQIIPTIKTYYGVTGSETIEKLAFVFRNATGSMEGKGDGGTDIFYDVFPPSFPFTVIVQNPTATNIIKNIGDTIQYHADASAPATLSLYDNGNLLTQVTDAHSISYDIIVSSGGGHHIELVADNGTEVINSAFSYIVPGSPIMENRPFGADIGINYLSDTSVLLAIQAPMKAYIYLIGDFNDWLLSEDYRLKTESNGQVHWIQLNGLTPGEKLGFQYFVEGGITFGDPYSEVILDPKNDTYIPTSTYPDMHPYPTGKTNGIVSVIQPGATPFDWQISDFQRPDKTKLVIYELLMRDFLGQPTYQTLTDTLDYLQNLGVNAIELMPINEFDANQSWGYNPVYHAAVDKYYGTKEDLKAFIDACHQRGMAVILDVVFNHAHENSPFAMLYWDDANFRPSADNPWLNQEATHAYNVFFDFNHESFATRAFVDKVLNHWITNYKIDGFRFDLSKGLTQNTGGSFDAWAYDASRIATLKHYANTIWNTSSDAYVILEHFTQNSEEKELADYGMMLWSGYDLHNNYLEAAMGYNSNLSGLSYQLKGWDEPHLVAYMESHDEERMVYKNIEFGNSNGSYSVKNPITAMERVELASSFFYPFPGPKMLWQFGELGYDYSINHCENGTVHPDCRLSPKPIRWDYFQETARKKIYTTISQLNHLKANYDVFSTDDYGMNVATPGKVIHLNHPDMNAVILGNFGVTSLDITPAFQHAGTWYEYFTQESIDVTDVNEALSFDAGEYRIYSDQPVAIPTGNKDLSAVEVLSIYPNPNSGTFTLSFFLKKSLAMDVHIIDLAGQVIHSEPLDRDKGYVEWTPTIELNAGIYLVQLLSQQGATTRKIVVTN